MYLTPFGLQQLRVLLGLKIDKDLELHILNFSLFHSSILKDKSNFLKLYAWLCMTECYRHFLSDKVY